MPRRVSGYDEAAVLAEFLGRQQEGLRLYRPLPTALRVHLSRASNFVARGGNQCLAGEQEIFDPVAGVSRAVKSIAEPFHVLSRNPVDGREVVGRALRPFVKGIGMLYRIRLSNGESFMATLEHRVLSGAQRCWLPLGACFSRSLPASGVPLLSNSASCPSGFQRDVGRSSRTPLDSTNRCSLDLHQCGEPLTLGADTALELSPQRGGARARSQGGWHADARGISRARSRPYQSSGRLSSRGAFLRAAALFGALGCQFFAEPCSPPFAMAGSPSARAHSTSLPIPVRRADPRFGEWLSLPCTSVAWSQSAIQEAPSSTFDYLGVISGCHHITSIEPIGEGPVWDFEVEEYANYQLAGILHHNSGKSTSCAAEIASAATRIPITGPEGELPFKYPTNRPLMIWLIGKGEDHIGDTFHRLLFQPGAFDVIRDEHTGLMRSFCPWHPADKVRAHEKEPAPPFIPERFYTKESWSWDGKGSHTFHRCELNNGTVFRAFSSSGDVKMGDPVDIIWIDEDIVYPEYVAEWQARLSKRKGRLIWSAWPHTANFALMKLSERAERQAADESPNVEEVKLRFSHNPYIDDEEKAKRLEDWSEAGPEEVRSRDLGDYITDLVLMYPNYSPAVHCIPPSDPSLYDKLDLEMEKRGWEPPADWCRRLFLDLGHSTTAGLFVATPPPEFGNFVVFYDELYLHNCDAGSCAEAVWQKTRGYWFQEWVIDNRYARQTITGIERTFKEIYAEAFAKYGLKSIATGTSFANACDDEAAGILAFRNWLRVPPSGRPIVRVVRKNLPQLESEIRIFKKKVINREAQDKAAAGQRDHQMDNCRYAASHGCDYVAPPQQLPAPTSPAYESFQNFYRRDGAKEPDSFCCGSGRAA